MKRMEYKFKPGDKVVCVVNPHGREHSSPSYGGAGWKAGKIFTISYITSDGICWGGVRGNGVWEDYLDIYKPVVGCEEELDKVITEEIIKIKRG